MLIFLFPLLSGGMSLCFSAGDLFFLYLSVCLSTTHYYYILCFVFNTPHQAVFSRLLILQEGEDGHVELKEDTLLCFGHLMADG